MSLLKRISDFFSDNIQLGVKPEGSIPEDPLLRKAWLARRTQELSEQRDLRSKNEESSFSMKSQVRSAGQYASRIIATVNSLWEKYFFPFISFFVPVGRLLLAGYKRLYVRFAFRKDETGARTQFCKKRSAATVAGLFTGTLLGVYITIFHLIPNFFLFSYDAVAVNFFAWQDSLVFSKPDWVVGSPGELSVFACRKYPCTGQDDSVEFRMRDSVYLDVIRTVTHFEPHDPGELAGAFLSEENYCTFKAYGVRVKYLSLYPYIIEASCRPVNTRLPMSDR